MKILSVRRMGNSVNGNPQYSVNTDEGAWKTKPDAAVSYEIPNWVGRDCWLTIDGYGYIVAVGEPLKRT
jgi:hypothetical protein